MSGIDYLLQQLINGLSLGAMYSLVAIGFTLYFGVIDIINFAHGDVFMLGAFIALAVLGLGGAALFHQAPLAGSLLVFVLTGGIGALAGVTLERTVIRPLRQAPALMVLLITLGASIVLREGVMLFYPNGANPQPFPRLFPAGAVNLGQLVIRYDQLFLVAVSAALITGLHFFVQHTRYGRFMRAIAQDREAAAMMGIDLDRVIMVTFALGSALGAVGGVLNGLYYNIVKFDMGFLIGIKGFAVAVVGGLGNTYGAVAGGLLLGLVEMLTVSFLPGGSAYQDVIAFLLLILFLAFRPGGLFSEHVVEKV